MGNKRADRLASEEVQGNTEFAAPVRPSDFRPLPRVRTVRECWTVGSVAETRVGWVSYTYSILPSISLVPWFR
jgi:hypothetical protein